MYVLRAQDFFPAPLVSRVEKCYISDFKCKVTDYICILQVLLSPFQYKCTFLLDISTKGHIKTKAQKDKLRQKHKRNNYVPYVLLSKNMCLMCFCLKKHVLLSKISVVPLARIQVRVCPCPR